MFNLTLIVLACTLHVSDKGVIEWNNKECKTKEYIIEETENPSMNPFTCMMRSPIILSTFMKNSPGYSPKKWTCKYVRQHKNI